MRWTLALMTMVALLVPLVSIAPAEAATPLNCARASTIVGFTAAGREVRVELLMRTSEPTRVEALLKKYGWDTLIGQADAVQLHYAHPSRYLVMATRGGCHAAHRFVEESEAKALLAE